MNLRLHSVLVSLLLASLAANAFGQLPDAKQLIEPINKLRSEAWRNERSGKPVNWQEVNVQVAQLASKAIEKVQFSEIPAATAEDWVSLFDFAGKTQEAEQLRAKAIELHSISAWQMQLSQLDLCVRRGDKGAILSLLDKMIGTDVRMIGQAGESVRMSITSKYSSTDPQFVVRCYDILLRRVDLSIPRSANDVDWARFAYAMLSAGRDGVLFGMGRQKEAIADLEKVREQVQGSAKALQTIDENSRQLLLVGKPATDIAVDKLIGHFSGLPKLKGKVVLLDFFAHWCGPCKAAFPDMKKLYADLHSKGVEVIGVTSFYGNFGAKQGLKPEEEFRLMKEAFLPEHGLPWAVVFEKNHAASKAYGVSGIPQLVIIDRTGKIRKIEVGYTKDEFAKTREFIEKLIAEPAKA